MFINTHIKPNHCIKCLQLTNILKGLEQCESYEHCFILSIVSEMTLVKC